MIRLLVMLALFAAVTSCGKPPRALRLETHLASSISTEQELRLWNRIAIKTTKNHSVGGSTFYYGSGSGFDVSMAVMEDGKRINIDAYAQGIGREEWGTTMKSLQSFCELSKPIVGESWTVYDNEVSDVGLSTDELRSVCAAKK